MQSASSDISIINTHCDLDPIGLLLVISTVLLGTAPDANHLSPRCKVYLLWTAYDTVNPRVRSNFDEPYGVILSQKHPEIYI